MSPPRVLISIDRTSGQVVPGNQISTLIINHTSLAALKIIQLCETREGLSPKPCCLVKDGSKFMGYLGRDNNPQKGEDFSKKNQGGDDFFWENFPKTRPRYPVNFDQSLTFHY